MKIGWTLAFTILLGNPISAVAYDGGGSSNYWLDDSVIANLATSQGADGNEAVGVFADMTQRSYSDLHVIANSKIPCRLYDSCGSLGDQLIAEIAEAAIKSKEFDDRADKDFWDSIQKIALLLLAGYGAWLGWVNRYRPRK